MGCCWAGGLSSIFGIWRILLLAHMLLHVGSVDTGLSLLDCGNCRGDALKYRCVHVDADSLRVFGWMFGSAMVMWCVCGWNRVCHCLVVDAVGSHCPRGCLS